jgi:hypothetical protein
MEPAVGLEPTNLLITNQLGPEIGGDRVSSDLRIYWEFVHSHDLADPAVFSCPSTIRPPTSARGMPQLFSLRTFSPVTWKCFAACSMWRSFV